ncbi:MAG: potassium channel family protein [Planctomycetota bacterium]|jgi:voltage-gated potassium channel
MTLFSINDHVIVCGFGSTGQLVAKDLAEQGVAVVVIDKSSEAASLAEDQGHLPLHGDVLDPDVMQEAGIDRARGVILLLPAESDNLFATMSARELNPDIFIIASHTSAHARAKFLRAGADRVVNPFEKSDKRIGVEFVRPAVTDLLRIFGEDTQADSEVRVREITISPGSPLIGQSLRDADIRAKMDIIVIAMRRAGDSTRFNPDPARPFEKGDVMVCMGRLAQLKELHEMGRGALE